MVCHTFFVGCGEQDQEYVQAVCELRVYDVITPIVHLEPNDQASPLPKPTSPQGPEGQREIMDQEEGVWGRVSHS